MPQAFRRADMHTSTTTNLRCDMRIGSGDLTRLAHTPENSGEYSGARAAARCADTTENADIALDRDGRCKSGFDQVLA